MDALRYLPTSENLFGRRLTHYKARNSLGLLLLSPYERASFSCMFSDGLVRVSKNLTYLLLNGILLNLVSADNKLLGEPCQRLLYFRARKSL